MANTHFPVYARSDILQIVMPRLDMDLRDVTNESEEQRNCIQKGKSKRPDGYGRQRQCICRSGYDGLVHEAPELDADGEADGDEGGDEGGEAGAH